MDDGRLDNPAGRLLIFIEDLAASGGGTVSGVIGPKYDVALEDRAKLFRVISELMDLPRQLRVALSRTPGVPEVYVETIPQVETWLKFLNNVDGGIVAAPDSLVTLLKLCSSLLSLNGPEVVPGAGVLLNIRTDAQHLLDEVVGADLDVDLRLFLAEQLQKLIEGIDTFRISGTAPVRAAVAEFAGELFLRRDRIRDLDEDSTEKAFVGRSWELASRAATAVALAPGAEAIAHFVIHALGTG